MKVSKFIESSKENKSKFSAENLYKGACVKIKNNTKTFQVIGINRESKICWIREWPFASEIRKTFAVEINQINLQIYCSSQFSE